MNTETPGGPENEASTPPPVSIQNYRLKWKSKPILAIFAVNALVVLVLVIQAIANSSFPNSSHIVVVCMACVPFPLSCILLIWAMHQLLKQYKEHDGIIKSTRLKYFVTGTSFSFCSSLFTLVGLAVAYFVYEPTPVKIVLFTFIGVCIIAGTISSVFCSIYGFCAAFDIYYHKNKNELVRNYLIASGIKEKETKMEDEEEVDEDQEERY